MGTFLATGPNLILNLAFGRKSEMMMSFVAKRPFSTLKIRVSDQLLSEINRYQRRPHRLGQSSYSVFPLVLSLDLSTAFGDWSHFDRYFA